MRLSLRNDVVVFVVTHAHANVIVHVGATVVAGANHGKNYGVFL